MSDGSTANKILVLHGNRQTGELLKGRLAKLQKAVTKEFRWEFVAPDAPFLFADGDEDLGESHHNDDSASSLQWQRTWWHRKGSIYNGLEESITKIQQLWDADNSFFCILGFSQGSRLAHIISTLHTVTNGDAFKGLRSVVHVSGYHSPMPPNFQTYIKDHLRKYNYVEEDVMISLPSLHIMGESDQLIPLHTSQQLSFLYHKPMIHIHSGGHYVPVKTCDIEQYLMFWRDIPSFDDPVKIKAQFPDEEHAQAQIDEVSALSQIFPSEFKLLSESTFLEPDNADPNDYSEQSRTYSHPISYTILLQPEDGKQQEFWPPRDIALHIEYPPKYPDCSPLISLQHEMNYFEFSLKQSDLLLNALMLAMKTEEGMPCIMSLVYAARDFFSQGGLSNGVTRPPAEKRDSEDICRKNDMQESSLTSFLLPSSASRVKECRQEGWLIACRMLEEYNRSKLILERSKSNGVGKGGSWKQFTIGLVGKPSAGKSTFFNAATAFARQRGGMTTTNKKDNEENIGGAAMAPHPFTTINPNIGFCFVPSLHGTCPEDDADGYEFLMNKGLALGSSHGRWEGGKRLLPVLLKDVAGLVPGAYEGRGKGNKFLDDLTDADVLIHVVDASGKADSEGNSIFHVVNPMNDLEWIRNEIVAWVYFNVKQKWDSVVRRGRTKLLGLFSGYKQSQSFVEDVFAAVERFVREHDGRDSLFDNLELFDEGDLYRLVSAFVSYRFPMGLALNKSDIPSSIPFIEEITAKLPIHGCFVAQSLSANTEMEFIRHHCLQSSLHSPLSNCSVFKCLQGALSLRCPILVFPVADMQTYAPLHGLNDFATRDSSLPHRGFINFLTAAGGIAPSNWDISKEMYVTPNSKSTKPALRDVMLIKPGSTVHDVFIRLKNMKALDGEFVRAEAASKLGEKAKPVSKSDIIGIGNRIIMIMTTKRKE